MPRIARCHGHDAHRLFHVDWIPFLTQLCLGGICCGVPFGIVRQSHPNLNFQTVMSSGAAHLDWETYSLPAPYGDNLAAQRTCLMVLSLFAAFPELTSIPAFNKGGQGWMHVNHAHSEIGVGNCHDGVGSIYCLSLDGQITLRALLRTHTPQYVFTTDVGNCTTQYMHQAARAAAVAGDA